MRVLSYLPFLLASAQAAPSLMKRARSVLPTDFVAGWAPGTWIENLAVRSNGNLIVTTRTPNAALWEITEPLAEEPLPLKQFTISGISSLLGITELTPDTFAIVGGNSSTTAPVPGTFGLWKASFGNGTAPTPKLVTKIPEAQFLNGATTVPGHSNIVLIADSFLGQVFRVDVSTGKYRVLTKQPEMAGGSNGTTGIQGLHIHDGSLYWTNDDTRTIWKLKVSFDGTPVQGAKVEKVVTLDTTALDDFIFGPGNDDTIWVATNTDNHVYEVNPSNGQNQPVAGGTLESKTPVATAVKFGRTSKDRHILYITLGEVAQTPAGRVYAIDTSLLGSN